MKLVYLWLLLLPLTLRPASVSLAWDASPSVVTEYVVHYGTSPGVYTSAESAGLSLSKTISGLPDGFRYYFAVTARAQEGESVHSNEITYRQIFNNPPIQIILQAESAILDHPFVRLDDTTAMGGSYTATTNTDRGSCRFVFTVPFMDEFVVWARVLSPTDGRDSFLVAHNNQPPDIYDTVRARTSLWQWTKVNGRGGSDEPLGSSHTIEPRLFIMGGSNEIKFHGRETWTGLDVILITNNTNLVPVAPSTPNNLQLSSAR